MKVGVPRESCPGERRVALVPAAVAQLVAAGLEVVVEAGAGDAAGYPDAELAAKGAVIADRDAVFASDVLAMVRAPGANPDGAEDDLARLRNGQVVIGLAEPLTALAATRATAARGVTLFALEMMPRITRAQSMDVLSSMATIAGYKAVLIAATTSPRLFPMLMTAAGTITAARVLVVGAGVAGLQAIATARRLGAVVEAYDVRPAVREQVLSLGARFVELPLETDAAQDAGGYARELGEEVYRRQREMMAKVVAASDVVITTAAVPGKAAPVLITAEMVAGMRPGAVIVDLAAERGGNCALTKPGETVDHHGVLVVGPLNLPATVPFHASQMFARNLVTFLLHLVREGAVTVNLDDEIVAGTLIARAGEVVHPRVVELLGAATGA